MILLTLKQKATIEIGDKVIIVSKTSKYRGCEAIVARTYPLRNLVGLYPIGYEEKYHPAQYNWQYDRYLTLVYDSVKKISNKEGEVMSMKKEKLTGYKKVAVIRTDGGINDYHFAIYDDGIDYCPGDKVMVSGNNRIQTIKEVITSEEAKERFGGDITAEVIGRIDTTAYDKRVEKRKEVKRIKDEMDKKVKEMDELLKYEMYAKQSPEFLALLDQYKELVR